jgi:hypothetical protein
MQTDVLSKWPLWRVVILGDSPDSTVIVYPAAVREGTEPYGAELEPALRRIASRQQALTESRAAPQERQITFLKARLPAELAKLEPRSFRIVAVFDNCDGDTSQLSVWMVNYHEFGKLAFWIHHPDPEAGCYSEYTVARDGSLTSDWTRDISLTQWALPANTKEVTIVRKPDETEWKIPLDQIRIIRDADLPLDGKEE